MDITQTDTTLITTTKHNYVSLFLGTLLFAGGVIICVSDFSEVVTNPQVLMAVFICLVPGLFFILFDKRTQLTVDKTAGTVSLQKLYVYGRIKSAQNLPLPQITGIESDIFARAKGGAAMQIKLHAGPAETLTFGVPNVGINFLSNKPVKQDGQVQDLATFMGVPATIKHAGRPLQTSAQ